MKQKLRTVAGVSLILLAIITGPIPIVQGWVFFVAGIGVLGTNHPISRWCLNQLRRFDWARKALEKIGLGEKPEDYPPGGPTSP